MPLLVLVLALSLDVTAEEEAVLAAVQQFFDAMAAKDVEGSAEVLAPEGRFFSVRFIDGEKVIRNPTNQEYLDGLAAGEDHWFERIWDPEIRIRGDVATVWAPYDFFVNREFSHCGVDALNLMKIDGRWVITGGSYTVEHTGCKPSPLGPPKFTTAGP